MQLPVYQSLVGDILYSICKAYLFSDIMFAIIVDSSKHDICNVDLNDLDDLELSGFAKSKSFVYKDPRFAARLETGT
ncbi:hypothetical protein FHL15_007189 [Xylaria flabelliformis]|uniref:Uncharacterized protein n=1 Tax=Xylaria flabelliformis TaxID=2512241 RepID=A0A553HV85_9PEZI|nr:hypothetical protein FHL15_007189 [Xylaria flabelliformis]